MAAALVMNIPASPTRGIDNFPSGSWSFGPLTVKWSLGAGSVDVKVSILGVNIDDLSGKLEPNGAILTDTLDVLGIVQGELTLEAIFNEGPDKNGLWIRGHIQAGSWKSGDLNHRIIPW